LRTADSTNEEHFGAAGRGVADGYGQTGLWRPVYQSNIILVGLARVKDYATFMT
jgi:hypothetical protein